MQEELLSRARQKLALARAYVLHKEWYQAHVLYGLTPWFIEGLAEIAQGPIGVTRGMIMYADPEWVAEQDVEELGGVLAHENHHILRGLDRVDELVLQVTHILEDEQRARELVNVGADMAINCHLRRARWRLPAGALYPEQYELPEFLTMEEYVRLLLDQPTEKQPRASGVCAGQCGGIAGNPVDQQVEHELDQQKGRTAADRELLRQSAMQDVAEEQQSKGRGSMPAYFEEALELERMEKVIPWRRMLQRTFRKLSGRIVSGMQDFSRRRMSKRSFMRGLIRPGMVEQKVEMAIIEDTSGSMGSEQTLACRTELINLMEQTGVESVWYLQADAAVALTPKRLYLKNIPALHTHGRGGTSFIPAIEAVKKLKPKIDLCVYLTDGDGDAPANKPRGFEFIWCLVPSTWQQLPADWGHVVVVSDDPAVRRKFD
jgi:predicted metal-dependent peptidase